MVEFLQLYYTSCKKGLSRSRGAQTYSMSEGLTSLERQEIEDYGLYLPPADLPSEPSGVQISTLFPVALTFFTLKSGRWGVCQSRYTGRDFSGRWGNYFCHALVVKEGTFPFYPIELFGASVFRDRLLPEEEDLKGQPAPLAVLSETDLALDGPVSREAVSDFLNRNPDGPVTEDMVAALLDHQNSRRRLVLCDAWERIPYWIGMMQMAFNLEAAHQLSFTTYIIDPQKTDCLVSATSRTGSRFSFSELERDHQYYLFNFTDGDYSRIEAKSRFGAAVHESYIGGAETWDVFQEFKTIFKLRDIDPDYEAAWSLFQISRNGFDGLDRDSILAAINLTESHNLSEIMTRLSSKMDALIGFVPAGADPATLSTMAGLLFKIADSTGQSVHLEAAFVFFLSALDGLIFQSDIPDRGGILDFNDHFLLARRDRARDFVTRTVSGQRLIQLENRLLEKPAPARAGILLALTVGNPIFTGINWAGAAADPSFLSLVRSCLEILLADREELGKALAITGRDAEYLARVTALAVDRAGSSLERQSVLVRAFIEVLQTKPSGFALKVRENLIGLGQEEFLFREFQTLLRSSTDQSRFFWNYQEQVFVPLAAYRRACFSRATRAYLDSAGPKPGLDECLRLMKAAPDLKDEDLGRVIKIFEDSLKIDSPPASLHPALSFAAELKDRRHIDTRPDVTGLLLLGLNLSAENNGEKGFGDRLPALFPEIKGILPKKYHAYLDWLLPLALPAISNFRDHAVLLSGLALEDTLDDLGTSYLRHLTVMLAREKRPYEKLWYFISFLLSPLGGTPGILGGIKKVLTGETPALLARQSRSTLREVAAIIERIEGLDRALWNNLLEKAEEKRDKSFKSRIMKLIRPRR